MEEENKLSPAISIILVPIVLVLAVLLSLNGPNQHKNNSNDPKLWQPPNSWEKGDGIPPGYDGVDLSKWRKR
jgi:hypothetical protein